MEEKGYQSGVIAGITAYVIWGFLPIYWKLIDHLSAMEVLAHRIIWSLVFMIAVLLFQQKLTSFWQEFKFIFSKKKTAIGIAFASIFISINWKLYIWAVANERIVEASLGYYINPLMSVILAVLFLKERLTRAQIISFILAFIGVAIMTIFYGVIPWVPLILALSFGLYGLMKKLVNADALFGLTIETMLVTPFALLGLAFAPASFGFNGIEVFSDPMTAIILVGSGIATAFPLLLFAQAARKIPLSLIGFLQYMAPTIMLFIGIFLYHEPFQLVQFFAFLFIWIGLIIFTASSFTYRKKMKQPIQHERTNEKSS